MKFQRPEELFLEVLSREAHYSKCHNNVLKSKLGAKFPKFDDLILLDSTSLIKRKLYFENPNENYNND